MRDLKEMSEHFSEEFAFESLYLPRMRKLGQQAIA